MDNVVSGHAKCLEEVKPMSETKGKTSTGMEQNLEGLLCYVLGWLTGIIFLLLEKDNKFVRFHAIQSILVFGAGFRVDDRFNNDYGVVFILFIGYTLLYDSNFGHHTLSQHQLCIFGRGAT
jgi:uncharacterized membrane protein